MGTSASRMRHGLVGRIRGCVTILAILTTSMLFIGTSTVVAGVLSSATGRAESAAPKYVWPKIAHDPGNTGLSADPAISTSNAGTLGVRWMAGIGASTLSSPVVAWNATLSKTLVYLGNETGYLTAFDEATGATVWSLDLGSPIVATPLVEGNFIWATRQYSPALYRIDAATGAIQCSVPLVSVSEGSPTIGTPAGGSKTVYIGVLDLGTQSGPVYAVNASNCAVKFSFTDFNSIAGSWDPLSFGTDANGRSLVLVGTSDPDESVYAIDAVTGARVWSFKTQPLTGNTDIDVGAGVAISPPGANGFADGVAYVPAEDGYMYALDLTSGALIWSHNFGSGLPQVHLSRSTPALAGRRVIFGESGGVTCLNAVTGALNWTFSTGDVESISAPAVVGPRSKQVVAVTTLAGAFDVLSVTTGELLYQYQTPGFTTSSFADVDGNLLASAADGFLYDLAPGGGNGTGPTTAVTSPADGSRIANPVGALTISGTATGAAIAGVDVAIQSGGASGPWWNGQTASWTAGFFDNPATVTSPGSSSTTWSFSLPVSPTGGTFRVLASAVQGNGLADVSDLSPAHSPSSVAFTVRNAPGTPHVYAAGGEWVAPGTAVTIAGSGFVGGETVTLSFNGAALASAVAAAAGSLPPTRVVIPVSAPFGPGGVLAKGDTSARSGTAPIYVSNEWTGAGYDAEHSGSEPHDEFLLRYPSPGPPEFLSPAWSYPTGAPVLTSVAVYRDVAYFANDSGVVTALDVRNSQPLWSTTEASGIDSSPALSSSQVFFGTMDDTVVSLKMANGSQAWSTPTSSAVESAPALAKGRLFVGSDDGTVYALSQASGAVIWHATVAGAVMGSPAVDSVAGIVVVGDTSDAITALSSATGALLWTVSTGGAVTATPTIFNGVVYVGSEDGNAYALSESTGSRLWVTATSGPITAGGAIFVPSARPTRYVVGSQDGSVTFINLRSGSVDAISPVGGPVVGLAAATGWVTVTTANGQVWGLKRSDGEAEWETSVTAPFATAPTVVNGVVYTSGTDQTVRAYTVPGTPIP